MTSADILKKLPFMVIHFQTLAVLVTVMFVLGVVSLAILAFKGHIVGFLGTIVFLIPGVLGVGILGTTRLSNSQVALIKKAPVEVVKITTINLADVPNAYRVIQSYDDNSGKSFTDYQYTIKRNGGTTVKTLSQLNEMYDGNNVIVKHGYSVKKQRLIVKTVRYRSARIRQIADSDMSSMKSELQIYTIEAK